MRIEDGYMPEFRELCDAQKATDDAASEIDKPAASLFSHLGLSLGALASVIKPLPLPETPESVCDAMKTSSDLEVLYYASRLEIALKEWRTEPLYSQGFRKETAPLLSQRLPF